MLKILFHLLGAIHFGYGCYYDQVHVNVPSTSAIVTPYAGKMKYLTHLNAIMQTLYFTLALLNDLFGNNEPTPSEKPLIRRIKDILFSALAFPLSMFVGITFWGIYAIDRELILPRSLDPYFPTWLNHVMHTNIMAFILIDLLTSFRMYPRKKIGLSVLCTYMLCYMVWIHVIYFKTGSWVYPILNILNWPLRVVFYLVCLGLVCSLYSLGEKFNKLVWSKEVEQTVKSGKKKAK
ncbi:androgen-dependent TFPI-regulating protein-like [Bombyx mandarina]|uniref:Androgen-induced gene 1 protein-like n=3 Tax=Bombyx TaxID=7090 RepID=A0A8R2AP38_BOMMO|nr:androgen-induced gene 1 protein [Bombyx mori]XP_028041513.1 androgen-dependent TFPI-regulating protein-like [Bombyx mandarina]